MKIGAKQYLIDEEEIDSSWIHFAEGQEDVDEEEEENREDDERSRTKIRILVCQNSKT